MVWPWVRNGMGRERMGTQIALLWWANGGPTVRVLMGQRWQPPVAHCGRVHRASVGPPVASHRWASVGPPLGQRWPNGTPTISALLGQRWLATGRPLLTHRWPTVDPTVHQR